MEYSTRPCFKWDSHDYLGLVNQKCYPWHFPFGMTKTSRIDPDPLPVSAVGEVLSGGITLLKKPIIDIGF